MNQTSPAVVVTEVGPGTGAAIARRFAYRGYAVAMLARNSERLTQLAHDNPHVVDYVERLQARPALQRTWDA